MLGDSWAAFAVSLANVAAIDIVSDRVGRLRVGVRPIEEEADVTRAPEPPALPRMLVEGAFKPRMHIMVPTQGNPRLIEFALDECKSRQAELQILFIRHLAVTPMGPMTILNLAEDEPALRLFERLRTQAQELGVPLRLLYGVARDIPDAILDMAVTHGADMLLLGLTRRGTLWKTMKGDVIQKVAEHLPEGIGLLIYA